MDELLNAIKRKLEESDCTDIDNPEDIATEVVELVKKRRTDAHTSGSGAVPSGSGTYENIEFEDDLPVFSHDGNIVHPKQIDRSFETLDYASGM